MKTWHLIILLVATALFSCTKESPEAAELRFVNAQRQKVSYALSQGGVNTDAAKPLIDSINAGGDTLWIDVSLDKPGNVRYIGFVEMKEITSRTEALDGGMDLETYSERLAYAAECIHVRMYYDSKLTESVASVGLSHKILRDSFGEFYAYQPCFCFNNGVSVSIASFFNNQEFYSFRDELGELLNLIGND